MTLENEIKDVIARKLEDGTIEKLIEEQLEKGVKNALENLFRSYGDVAKIIEDKVKSVMVPYLESYDYSRYITKLDSVLVEVLKSSALENKTLLENFKELMALNDNQKQVKLSDLFSVWMSHVSHHVETDGLEINYDDEPTYENVEVTLEVNDEGNYEWSSFERAAVAFQCEHDEKMNFALRVTRWKNSSDKSWDIEYNGVNDIRSLRYLSEFEVYLMRLSQNRIKLDIDTTYETDYVEVEDKPEVNWR